MSADETTDRIGAEIEDIETAVREAQDAWGKYKKSDDRHFLNSTVLNIHSFYLGLERIFKNIAKKIDGDLPEGSHWHRDLLSQMNEERNSTRPAVISDSTRKQLDEYRKFFHVIRNIYGIELKPARIKHNLNKLEKVWNDVKKELNSFLNFLKTDENE